MALGVELPPAPPALQPRLTVAAPGQLEHLQSRSNCIAQCSSADLITAYVEVGGGRMELQHLKHVLSSVLGWITNPPPKVVADLVDHVADQVQAGLLAWADCLYSSTHCTSAQSIHECSTCGLSCSSRRPRQADNFSTHSRWPNV